MTKNNNADSYGSRKRLTEIRGALEPAFMGDPSELLTKYLQFAPS